MSTWAELDKSNQVIRVLVCDDNDPNGDRGYQWLVDNLGGTWKETFADGSSRKNFAGEGFIYDETGDAFHAPQPYPSWKLDRRNFQWKPPTAMPQDDKYYIWNEELIQWMEMA